MQVVRRFINDEAGATAIEYGLLAALIAVALIGTFAAVGNNLVGLMDSGAGSAARVIADRTNTL